MRSRATLLQAALAACAAWWGVGELFVAVQATVKSSSSLTGSHGAPRGSPLVGSQQTAAPVSYLSSTLGCSLLAAATALAVKGKGEAANREGVGNKGKTSTPRPDEVAFRSDRKKGEQNLPLGSRFQKFFSVRNRVFWDYKVYPKTYFGRQWLAKDFMYAAVFGIIHVGAAFAPFYFTWKAFACFLVGYLITGLFGITLSYHRQLSHRSFKSPKWVEYLFAYCGALAMQSHPINWCSSHRHHHGATDTESDVHSPKDGFWWAHAGWLLDQQGTWMRCDKNNASDLAGQWFYKMLQYTYPLHAIVLPIVGLAWFGGLPCVLWGFFFRVVWVWHVTWAVNSVSHVWGYQDWNTGDISMNNWIVGILAFGEGWHNNHHAFEQSCRHGLKWYQVDPTWYVIKTLEFFGLAWDLKYPTQSKMRKLSWDNAPVPA